MKRENPFGDRLAAFSAKVGEKGLDAAVVFNQANICGLTGIDCDNACLLVRPGFSPVFYTPIKKALHGDSSGVCGAAWLWK